MNEKIKGFLEKIKNFKFFLDDAEIEIVKEDDVFWFSRAVKAGITNNAPINNEPTARKANTVNKASNSIKIRRCHLALIPSLTAMSGSMAI